MPAQLSHEQQVQHRELQALADRIGSVDAFLAMNNQNVTAHSFATAQLLSVIAKAVVIQVADKQGLSERIQIKKI